MKWLLSGPRVEIKVKNNVLVRRATDGRADGRSIKKTDRETGGEGDAQIDGETVGDTETG